jgi:hypothetical protein
MVMKVVSRTFIQDPSFIERVDTYLISAIVREIFSLLYLGSAVKDWRLEGISDCHTAEYHQNFFIKKKQSCRYGSIGNSSPLHDIFHIIKDAILSSHRLYNATLTGIVMIFL